MSQVTATAAAPRTVTDDEVSIYARNGWVFLPGFVTRSIAAEMLSAVQSVMGESPQGDAPETAGHGGHKYVYSAEKRGGAVQDAGYWQDYHFAARDDQLEPLRSVAFSEQIGRAAQRLMRRNIPIRFSSDIVACKMPAGMAGGLPTAWHQDFASAPVDRSHGLAFWIALDEVTPEMGSMRFLNGSQAEGCLGRTRIQGKGVDEYYPELYNRYELSEPITLQPGDATAHNCLVCHGAPDNRTDKPRWGYIMAYFAADTLYTGASNHNFDGIGLETNKPLDHPRFPVICT